MRRRIELPEPGKPVAEMTAAERAAYVTALRRALRDDEVRHGKRKPRTMRETEIFLQGLPGRMQGTRADDDDVDRSKRRASRQARVANCCSATVR
jgi:hypothetical protein